MLLKKQGLPEEAELVLCTVTDIQIHSVFVNLDEYNKQGMIHISEISPGRIRNLRDFVTIGKKIVCKVLRINFEKQHIDLSFRRVNEGQKKNKINEIKQEQKSEKILEFAAKELKMKVEELYDIIWKPIEQKGYSNIHPIFNMVVIEDFKLTELGIDKKYATVLEELIKQRIKPPEVQIGGELSIRTYAADGINQIKKILQAVLDTDKDITIKYEGAGKYYLVLTKSNYKEAEKLLKEITEKVIEDVEKLKGTASFKRKEIQKKAEDKM